MSRFFAFWGMILLPWLMVPATAAAFPAVYIFGDAVSATAFAPVNPGSSSYYGYRYSNGRSWVEVLAQRQGLGATSLTSTNWNYSTNNRSYYGHYSYQLVTNVNNFVSPANASNCLFVVWVANADFVEDITANPPPTTNLVTWTNLVNQHITNHIRAITNLYAKGMRTLIAPNAVDLTKVPQYSGITISYPGYRNFVRQRIVEFNNAYSNRLNQIEANNPGLNIIYTDIFSLLEDIQANASKYGLTNVLDGDGTVSCATARFTSPLNLNGPGTNYIWWGPIAPSARFHEVIADTVQQMVSPASVESVIPRIGSNELQLANAPVAMNGLVLFSTDLAQTNWLTNSAFSTLATNQSVFVNPTNSLRFYRLKFPWQWTWP